MSISKSWRRLGAVLGGLGAAMAAFAVAAPASFAVIPGPGGNNTPPPPPVVHTVVVGGMPGWQIALIAIAAAVAAAIVAAVAAVLAQRARAARRRLAARSA